MIAAVFFSTEFLEVQNKTEARMQLKHEYHQIKSITQKNRLHRDCSVQTVFAFLIFCGVLLFKVI